MSDHELEPHPQQKVLEAMRAVLSDDHNYERGILALRGIIDQVATQTGATGLSHLTMALSLALAAALERIAGDNGLAAEDLAEIWFAD